VLNLDGNAAGQASYRQAGLPFPLIDCGSGGLGAKVVVKKVERSNMLDLDGNAAGQASYRQAKLHFLLVMVVTLLWCNVSIMTTLSLRRPPGVQLPL
jgi:hypothetical protein